MCVFEQNRIVRRLLTRPEGRMLQWCRSYLTGTWINDGKASQVDRVMTSWWIKREGGIKERNFEPMQLKGKLGH